MELLEKLGWLKRCPSGDSGHMEGGARGEPLGNTDGSNLESEHLGTTSHDVDKDLKHDEDMKEYVFVAREDVQDYVLLNEEEANCSPENQIQEDQQATMPIQESQRMCCDCKTKVHQIEKFRTFGGSDWHLRCFRCRACHFPIEDNKFFTTRQGSLYHNFCRELRSRIKQNEGGICIVCHNPFVAGKSKVNFHPFWKQYFCCSHEKDRTASCCSCERLQGKDKEYRTLDDGRIVCSECLNSAVTDSSHGQSLYMEIVRFFEKNDLKVEQWPPLFLVDRQALNEAMARGRQGHHDGTETRGLYMGKDSERGISKILILGGLPWLLTGSILAHEFMHAWFDRKGYSRLSLEVEEGMCHLMAHRWLESRKNSSGKDDRGFCSSSSSSSPVLPKEGREPKFEETLCELFRYLIESETLPNYGMGFKKGRQAVENNGLKKTLDIIYKTGTFPN